VWRKREAATDMKDFEKKLGYEFKNQRLLINALTHSSYANENRGEGYSSNERLEFLGDSVLGVVAASYLYSVEPPLPEGRMTKLRAELVCETALHQAALELELGRYLRLGRGEERTGGARAHLHPGGCRGGGYRRDVPGRRLYRGKKLYNGARPGGSRCERGACRRLEDRTAGAGAAESRTGANIPSDFRERPPTMTSHLPLRLR
jgi:dsRNA-specific ribonuclease